MKREVSTKETCFLILVIFVLSVSMYWYNAFHMSGIQTRGLELAAQHSGDMKQEDIERAIDTISHFRWLLCVLYPFTTLIKVSLIAGLLKTSSLLFELDLDYFNLFFVALFANVAVGVSNFLTIIALNRFFDLSSFQDPRLLSYPFSLGALIHTKNVILDDFLFSLNLPEMMWWIGCIFAITQCFQERGSRLYRVVLPVGASLFLLSFCVALFNAHS